MPVGRVILCDIKGVSLDQSLSIFPDAGVAVVCITPLKTDDAELYGRRVKRQVSRAIGLLVGVGYNPNPRCCMQPVKDIEHFDSISYNMSPPPRVALERALRQKGVQLIGDRERIEALKNTAETKKQAAAIKTP